MKSEVLKMTRFIVDIIVWLCAVSLQEHVFHIEGDMFLMFYGALCMLILLSGRSK